MKVGDRVRLTESYIKRWVLSHSNYNCYHCGFSGEAEARSYDVMVQVALCELLGSPVYGKIIKISDSTGNYLVEFMFNNIKDDQWYDRKMLK